MKTIAFAACLLALSAHAQEPCTDADNALAARLQALYDSNPRVNAQTTPEAQAAAQQALIAHLRDMAENRPDTAWRCTFAHSMSEHAFHAPLSADKRLRAFSWDTHSGGSLHHYHTLLIYRDDTGNTRLIAPAAGESEHIGTLITAIHSADLPGKGRAWWLESHATLMNGYYLRSIRLTHEKDGQIRPAPWIFDNGRHTDHIRVEYDAFAADNPAAFAYNAADHTLTAPVTVCASGKPRPCTLQNATQRYRFDGENFIPEK